MACQDALKKDLNIPYIDADIENDVSSDEAVTKNIMQQEVKLSMESREDGEVQLHSDKQKSIPHSQDCVIDMSGADEDIGASLNFGLTRKVDKKATKEGHEEIETLCCITPSVKASTWKNVNVESTAANSQTVEIQKKVKKKKRYKPKGSADQQDINKHLEEKKQENEISANSNITLGKPGTSDWSKKLERQKSVDLESQPLLGTDSSSNRGNSNGSRSQKKRASKTLSAKKDSLSDGISHSASVSQSSTQTSKDKQGKANKNAEEDVEKLMKKHGLFESSSTNKKKAKENKHTLSKKSKKKVKKSKKEDKQKEKESSDLTETEPTESLEPILIDAVQDDSVFCVSGEVLTKDSSGEFVTQGRRKATPRQPTSGQASPKTLGTRKRRFSDPSPSVNKSASGTFANSQRSFPHNRKANSRLNDKSQGNSFALSEVLCNRESQLQWPTLPSLVDPTNCKGTSRQSTTSYASKLRSNLDSTGCSLASSSEDGSSTASSSSNNYSSCLTEQISPDNEHHTGPLTDIPCFVTAAAAQMLKDISPSTVDCPQPTLRDLTKTSPTRVAGDVVSRAEDEEETDADSVCAKTKVDHLNNAVVSSALQEFSSNDNTSPTADAGVLVVRSEPEAKTVVLNDEFHFESNENNEIIFEFMADIDATTSSDVKVMSELENEWGLNFFTDDFSRDKLGSREQIYNGIVEPKNTLVHVTFAADKFIFNGTVPEASLINRNEPMSKISNNSFLLPNISMRIDGPRTSWNDPGDFDLKKATHFLLQEWNTAVAKGNSYREE